MASGGRLDSGFRYTIAGTVGLCVAATFMLVMHSLRVRAAASFRNEVAKRHLDLNWQHFVPKPSPPAENYYDAPVVRSWFVGKGTKRGLKKDGDIPAVPSVPNGWFRSPLVSLEELRELPRDGTNASLARLAEHLDEFEPGFAMLRDAARRPHVQLPGDYSAPERTPTPNITAMRNVAQVIATAARVHLLLQEPERVINDLDSLEAVMRGFEPKPTWLVSSMLRVAIGGLYMEVVREGFSLNAWSGKELAALESRLRKMDLIGPLMASLTEGEMVIVCCALNRMAEADPDDRLQFLRQLGYRDDLSGRLVSYLPASSIRNNLLLTADIYRDVPQIFAADGTRFSPEAADQLAARMSAEFKRTRPGNMFAGMCIPSFTHASATTARNQTLIHLGVIACLLEQYRAAHGSYPETLAAFEERAVPRDLITGELPIYHRTKTAYALYSPGLDQNDDGGTARDWVFAPFE